MKRILLCCALIIQSFPSYSNDGIAYDSSDQPRLGKVNNIAMKKEVVDISWGKISTGYDLVNESTEDEERVFSFPLPEYQIYVDDDLRYYGDSKALLILADSRPVEYKTLIQSFIKIGKKRSNITKDLKDAGLSDEQIAW